MAPFYVEQEAPAPPGGLPRPGKIVANLRNEHLQYALTWFGLAVVLLVGSAFGRSIRAASAPAGTPRSRPESYLRFL